MYPILYEDVRRALLQRFPYSVFFVAEKTRAVVLGGSPSAPQPGLATSALMADHEHDGGVRLRVARVRPRDNAWREG